MQLKLWSRGVVESWSHGVVDSWSCGGLQQVVSSDKLQRVQRSASPGEVTENPGVPISRSSLPDIVLLGKTVPEQGRGIHDKKSTPAL